VLRAAQPSGAAALRVLRGRRLVAVRGALLPAATGTRSIRLPPARAPPCYSDEKVANREIRVWHGATENGP
jgi:hypothetical protein